MESESLPHSKAMKRLESYRVHNSDVIAFVFAWYKMPRTLSSKMGKSIENSHDEENSGAVYEEMIPTTKTENTC